MASFSAKDYAGSQIYFMVGSGSGTSGDPYIQTISMAASSAVIGSVTQSGTWNVGTVSTVTNLSQLGGVAIAMGSGVRSPGTQRVTIATDDSVAVTGTFWQATQPVSLASLPALAAGTNTIGSVGDVATTTGGTTGYSSISTSAVLAAEIKGSAGTVYSVQVFNTNAAPRYVRIYDQTGAPGSGDAANIVWRGTVPGNTSAAGFNIPVGGSKGIACSTGIGIRASAAIADNDTTVLAANELIFNVQYK